MLDERDKGAPHSFMFEELRLDRSDPRHNKPLLAWLPIATHALSSHDVDDDSAPQLGTSMSAIRELQLSRRFSCDSVERYSTVAK